MTPRAEEMRALVASGMTVKAAGAQMGLTPKGSHSLATRHGIKADPAVIQAVRDAAARKGGATRGEQIKAERAVHAARAARNPFLTTAQQANVDAWKNRSWKATALSTLPPMSEDEAQRLVVEHIAKRGVTKCPPAARIELPINGGMGWR